jgi:hypothetical protein
VLLRWLLPVLTVLGLLASSITAYAGAGIVGDTACCCPDPRTCKCHDHDGNEKPASELKRCGGEAKLVMAVAPAPLIPETETRQVEVPVHATLPMPPSRSERPEKPPF